MDFLPLFHSLQGRLALVVGGGEVALRKDYDVDRLGV